MKNLEDPAILREMKIVRRLYQSLGMELPAEVHSAVHAYVEAIRHPNSLIRVHVTKDGQEEKVFGALANINEQQGTIDWVKSSHTSDVSDSDPLHLFTFEFKNGSAIEMRVGK